MPPCLPILRGRDLFVDERSGLRYIAFKLVRDGFDETLLCVSWRHGNRWLVRQFTTSSVQSSNASLP